MDGVEDLDPPSHEERHLQAFVFSTPVCLHPLRGTSEVAHGRTTYKYLRQATGKGCKSEDVHATRDAASSKQPDKQGSLAGPAPANLKAEDDEPTVQALGMSGLWRVLQHAELPRPRGLPHDVACPPQ